jgi:hypothetical protein
MSINATFNHFEEGNTELLAEESAAHPHFRGDPKW